MIDQRKIVFRDIDIAVFLRMLLEMLIDRIIYHVGTICTVIDIVPQFLRLEVFCIGQKMNSRRAAQQHQYHYVSDQSARRQIAFFPDLFPAVNDPHQQIQTGETDGERAHLKPKHGTGIHEDQGPEETYPVPLTDDRIRDQQHSRDRQQPRGLRKLDGRVVIKGIHHEDQYAQDPHQDAPVQIQGKFRYRHEREKGHDHLEQDEHIDHRQPFLDHRQKRAEEVIRKLHVRAGCHDPVRDGVIIVGFIGHIRTEHNYRQNNGVDDQCSDPVVPVNHVSPSGYVQYYVSLFYHRTGVAKTLGTY